MAPEAFGGLHGDTLIATRFPCSDDLEYRDHDVLGLDVGTGQVRWRRNAHLLDGGQGTKVLVTRGGTLSALDTETGETDWSTDIPADVGGNATPDLALVPSPDTDGGAAVVAYARSSGRRQWVFPPGGVPLEGRWNFAVAGDRRRVVVSSYGARSDPSVPDHHVLDARTGEVMATFNATAGVRGSMAGTLFVDRDGTLSAISTATGTTKWERPGVSVRTSRRGSVPRNAPRARRPHG